jgi:3-phenylpropionate/trans-cinnamate dioxygenase ferredoxin component
MADSFDVMPVDDLAPGCARAVRLGQRDVALFRVGAEVFALDNSCPHAGASLAAGKLNGRIVTCRAHGMRFDVATGCMPGIAGLEVARYPVQLMGGRIHVRIDR